MTAEQDSAAIRRGYEAFNHGDLDTMAQVVAEDAVWHVAGRNRLSGAKQGRDAIFGYFGELGQAGLSAELHDVISNEQHSVGLHTSRGERDGRRLETHVVLVFHMRDGRVQEAWEQAADTRVLDELYG